MDINSVKASLSAVRQAPARSSVTESPGTQQAGAVLGETEQLVIPSGADIQDVSREQIESAVSAIQDFVQAVQRNVNFSVEDSSGRVVVKVTDASSGDVIRQIPSEEAMQLAESLEEVRSLLFKAEA